MTLEFNYSLELLGQQTDCEVIADAEWHEGSSPKWEICILAVHVKGLGHVTDMLDEWQLEELRAEAAKQLPERPMSRFAATLFEIGKDAL